MKFVRDMKCGKDSDLQRIDRQRPGRDLAHLSVDVIRKVHDVFIITVGTDTVILVIDLDPDRLLSRFSFTSSSDHLVYLPTASATSASMIVIASSIASTFN